MTSESPLRFGLVGTGHWARVTHAPALAAAVGIELAAVWGRDAQKAARLAADLGKRFPQDTVVQFDYLPMIRAAIALQSGNAERALEALAASAPYEMGQTNSAFTFALYPVYLRGQAHLAARNGAAAVSEFQKILDHAGVIGNQPIGALTRLGLGRAYALSGDTTKAKTAYQDFLSLWNNADPDILILKQAKTEYAKLH